MVDILSLMSSINEDIKKLFEQAYQQAYMQGRRDQSLISVYKYEEDAIHNQWTDFLLPSKILLGNYGNPKSDKWHPYSDLMPYPTKEEVKELIEHTDFNLVAWQSSGAGMHWWRLRIHTKPGAAQPCGLELRTWDWHYECTPLPENEHVDFWIKEEDAQKATASILRLTFERKSPVEYNVHSEIIDDVFKGECAHWLIVKRPNKD